MRAAERLTEPSPQRGAQRRAECGAKHGAGHRLQRPQPELIGAARMRQTAYVPHPGKIVCVGLNYREHVTEGGRGLPARPLLFAKFANTVIGDGDPIVRPEGRTRSTSRSSSAWSSGRAPIA